MLRANTNDLIAFIAVARERSFTKAAAKLGITQPALSQTIRELEERLGIRLLTRTTRSVSPTEAGEHLLRTLGPHFDEIEAELASLSEFREKPAGTIRISAADYAADAILLPKLSKLLLKGRLRFGDGSKDAPFPSAIVVWGADPDLTERLHQALPPCWHVPARRADEVA